MSVPWWERPHREGDHWVYYAIPFERMEASIQELAGRVVDYIAPRLGLDGVTWDLEALIPGWPWAPDDPKAPAKRKEYTDQLLWGQSRRVGERHYKVQVAATPEPEQLVEALAHELAHVAQSQRGWFSPEVQRLPRQAEKDAETWAANAVLTYRKGRL